MEINSNTNKDLLIDFLLMPIEHVGLRKLKVPKIDFKTKRILSPQKYNHGNDADVSNASVEFYEAIYGIKIIDIEHSIKLSDEQFCGDTMINPKLGGEMCRCLANFWILPKHVGHSSRYTKGLMYLSKSAICKDDMGKFLKFYNQNIASYQKEYPDYVKRFEENFEEDHFIDDIDYSKTHSREAIKTILKERARKIVNKKQDEINTLMQRWIG